MSPPRQDAAEEPDSPASGHSTESIKARDQTGDSPRCGSAGLAAVAKGLASISRDSLDSEMSTESGPGAKVAPMPSTTASAGSASRPSSPFLRFQLQHCCRQIMQGITELLPGALDDPAVEPRMSSLLESTVRRCQQAAVEAVRAGRAEAERERRHEEPLQALAHDACTSATPTPPSPGCQLVRRPGSASDARDPAIQELQQLRQQVLQLAQLAARLHTENEELRSQVQRGPDFGPSRPDLREALEPALPRQPPGPRPRRPRSTGSAASSSTAEPSVFSPPWASQAARSRHDEPLLGEPAGDDGMAPSCLGRLPVAPPAEPLRRAPRVARGLFNTVHGAPMQNTAHGFFNFDADTDFGRQTSLVDDNITMPLAPPTGRPTRLNRAAMVTERMVTAKQDQHWKRFPVTKAKTVTGEHSMHANAQNLEVGTARPSLFQEHTPEGAAVAAWSKVDELKGYLSDCVREPRTTLSVQTQPALPLIRPSSSTLRSQTENDLPIFSVTA